MVREPPLRIRSLLFLPAVRLDRLEKAFATGADRVCVDLEDGVGPDSKDTARDAVAGLLDEADHPGLVIRINSPRTEEGLRDLLVLMEARPRSLEVMIPKVESADEVRWIEELLGRRHRSVGLHLLVETARGIEAAVPIATASPRLVALMLGGVDLSADLGAALDWEPLQYARSRIVSAAAIAGAGALDTIVLALDDEDSLRSEALRARRMGFAGKLAIHPKQITPIHEAFSPSPEEIAHARRIAEAYERNRGGVTVLDGRLVELPVLRSALRILNLAERTHPHDD